MTWMDEKIAGQNAYHARQKLIPNLWNELVDALKRDIAEIAKYSPEDKVELLAREEESSVVLRCSDRFLWNSVKITMLAKNECIKIEYYLSGSPDLAKAESFVSIRGDRSNYPSFYLDGVLRPARKTSEQILSTLFHT